MAARTNAAKAPVYDPAKRYGVTLSRVVEHEGFTLKPGPNPIEMSGDWANLHADAIAEASELSPQAPLPERPDPIHEAAEG